MYLRRLQLTNFRCYDQLDLTLPCGSVVLAGRNAQGKTSILEAVHVLATTRSPNAQADRELLRWQAVEDEVLPYSRVRGEIVRSDGPRNIEVLNVRQVTDRGDLRYAKQARVGGVSRRAIDVLGHLNVVLFTPQDIRVVDGPPGERRRYLDGLICQIDPGYCRALGTYNKLLTQRNHLLRRLRDRSAGKVAGELAYWDERLAKTGARLIARRQTVTRDLEARAREIHHALAGPEAKLDLVYRSSLELPTESAGAETEQTTAPVPVTEAEMGGLEENGDLPPSAAGAGGLAEAGPDYETKPPEPSQDSLATAFTAALAERRREQIARGVTVIGPHRDDLRFLIDGVDMRTYGSRGQQRTIVLALKLAEAQLMWAETGERPVVLLDDVLSELDPERRDFLMRHLDGRQQTLITTTDPEGLPADFLDDALLLRVESGRIVAAEKNGRSITPPVA